MSILGERYLGYIMVNNADAFTCASDRVVITDIAGNIFNLCRPVLGVIQIEGAASNAPVNQFGSQERSEVAGASGYQGVRCGQAFILLLRLNEIVYVSLTPKWFLYGRVSAGNISVR